MIINDCKSNTRGIVIHMWAYYPSTHLQMYCWMYYSMQWQMSLSIMHNDARDTVWELEGSTLYSLGTGGEHVMSWFSLETGGEHVMSWYSNTRVIVLHMWAYCPSTHLQMYCWMYYSMQWKMSLSIMNNDAITKHDQNVIVQTVIITHTVKTSMTMNLITWQNSLLDW